MRDARVLGERGPAPDARRDRVGSRGRLPGGGPGGASGSVGTISSVSGRTLYVKDGSGNGARPGASARVQAALKGCGATSRAPITSTPAFRASVVKYVACVRKHGYPLPSPKFSGRGAGFSQRIQTNPKFKTASNSCQDLLATGDGQPPATGPG